MTPREPEPREPEPAIGSTARWARAALSALAPACALGTFASEITVGFATTVAVISAGLGWRHRARHARPAEPTHPGGPLGGAATWSYALAWLVLVPVSGDLREGLGHIWPITPLFVVPPLLARLRARGSFETPPKRPRSADLDPPGVRVGLQVSAVVGAAAAVEGLFREAHGPFSHHLTLAYALLPPLGVALHRRSALAVPIALGVLGSRSSGAVIALAVTVVLGVWAGVAQPRPAGGSAGQVPPERAPPKQAAWHGERSGIAALIGMAATVLALPLADRAELHQRAILWTGGLMEGLGSGIDAPAGPGGYPAASAPLYERLQPGFWFPNHAHDSAVQLLAVLGPTGWLCGVLLVVELFRAFGAGAAAGLAGVCIGSLTQDTFGDLEVVRSVVVWGCLTAGWPREPGVERLVLRLGAALQVAGDFPADRGTQGRSGAGAQGRGSEPGDMGGLARLCHAADSRSGLCDAAARGGCGSGLALGCRF